MGLFSSPKALFSTRIVQFIFGVAFLILICYSGTHRGWWRNINGALAVGVIASIFTFAVAIHDIWTYYRRNATIGSSRVVSLARLALEIVGFLLWIATAGLMLLHKGGCTYPRTLERPPHSPTCSDNPKEDRVDWKLQSNRPTSTWNAAVAFSFVEICICEQYVRRK